ncbi:MFS transporter [Methylobacterium durans]|uniref:MFS transporter n=1 Tax=Methylobacterium durans TaxID=2202825 RepID=A0A2U8WFJ7_9HYPH|nr:MFS transporter [Methylobacterium durans]AWN44311.1 MFS transporter [Methylobacterium durans]
MRARPTGALRLSLLYAVVFVEIGIAMPFMPLWLGALGLDASIIGLLLALPIATRIVATAPLVGLIDRGVSARTLLMAGSLGVALTYGLMPAGAGLGWLLLAALTVLNAVAAAPLVPSIDYLTLAAVRREPRLDYARIRLSGSVAFLAANMLGGALLGALGEALAVPLLLTGLALIASLVAYASRTVASASPTPPAGEARPRLPARLWLCILAAASIQASHAAIYGFGSLYWTAHGIATAWVGTLWAIGVGAEIVLFALIGLAPARWRTPFRLLALGGGAALLRSAGMTLYGTELAMVIALQCLHGLTFGATQLGAMAAVSAFAPEGARGRAQGTLSAVNALAAASATLLSGLAYRDGGALAFALMAPLALAGLGLTLAASRAARRPPAGPFGTAGPETL